MTDKKQTTRKFKYGALLIWSIAIVQGARFSLAFVLADTGHLQRFGYLDGMGDVIGGMLIFAGLLLGMSVELGNAYIASSLPGLRGKTAIRLAWGALGSLFLIAPLILTPVTYAGVDDGLRQTFPWYILAGWALVLSFAPSIVTVGVAVVDRDSVTSKQATVETPEESKPATVKEVLPPKKTVEPKMYRCECGHTNANRFKFAGHQRKCAVHATVKSGQPIPVEFSAKGK